ncbi:MAG: zf-HC2 domain-containing protein [Chloroflexota bacterium]
MIDHRRARVLQATAFDFDLALDDRRRLDDHLAACAACRRFDEQLRADQLGAMKRPLSSLPPSVSRTVESAALEWQPSNPAAVGGRVELRGPARPPVRALAWLIVAIVVGATTLAVIGATQVNLDRLSPQPSALPTAVPTPVRVAQTFPPPPGAALVPGTYAIGPRALGITVSLPAGWVNRGDGDVSKIGRLPMSDVGLAVGMVDNIYADPCRWELGLLSPKVGPTAKDLADAIVAHWSPDLVSVRRVTIDGHDGWLVDITIPDDAAGCEDGIYRTVAFPNSDDVVARPGTHARLWVIDRPGGRAAVSATDFPESLAAERDELQQVIDSIRIEGAP